MMDRHGAAEQTAQKRLQTRDGTLARRIRIGQDHGMVGRHMKAAEQAAEIRMVQRQRQVTRTALFLPQGRDGKQQARHDHQGQQRQCHQVQP